jgi:two-component system cell cycle sensor histidine kinase/response regulator CckA
MATVLVVDDEPVIRDLISVILEGDGFSVLTAAGGSQALSLSREHRGEIDVLVSDVVMPEIDGPSLAAQLLNDDPKLQVLFISGCCETQQQIENCRQFPFLPKPFSITTLLRTVRRLVGKCATAAASQAAEAPV